MNTLREKHIREQRTEITTLLKNIKAEMVRIASNNDYLAESQLIHLTQMLRNVLEESKKF